MSYIESTKSYTGSEMDAFFFTPMVQGDLSEALGIRVLYNMPVPTTISHFVGDKDILSVNDGSGWSGSHSTKSQVKVDMKRLKAEMSYSAADYYSMVFDNLATKNAINGDDLTGSALEAAETEIFARSIYDSLRASMWFGNTKKDEMNTFDGLFSIMCKKLYLSNTGYFDFKKISLEDADYSVELFDKTWSEATSDLRDLKGDGNLVYFVSPRVYDCYERYLNAMNNSASYVDIISGRPKLYYHGIEVCSLGLEEALVTRYADGDFCILTDRRNLVLAINTADFPGSEVRMWYNPDEMENRQRATFAVGCQVVDYNLLSAGLSLIS